MKKAPSPSSPARHAALVPEVAQASGRPLEQPRLEIGEQIWLGLAADVRIALVHRDLERRRAALVDAPGTSGDERRWPPSGNMMLPK